MILKIENIPFELDYINTKQKPRFTIHTKKNS